MGPVNLKGNMVLSEKTSTTTLPESISAEILMNTLSDMEPARLQAENHQWFIPWSAESLVTMAAFTARNARDGICGISAVEICSV